MRYFYLLAFILFSGWLFGQPINDDCEQATLLTNLDDYCSGIGAFSNEGATPSDVPNPSCTPIADEDNDVWFTFVAQVRFVSVRVVGETQINAGGTLQRPAVTVYSGDNCSTLTEIACSGDGLGADFAQVIASDLVAGNTYYVRVSGEEGLTGTFQFCINNFNRIPDPAGDCESAIVLCDKSPISVEFAIGRGEQEEMLTQETLCTTCGPFTELGSTWFKWVCEDPGTLTLDIDPISPVDDIDFWVFELPNGVNNCAQKENLRCMVSGRNRDDDVASWISCTGTTGLRDGDGDAFENCGCSPGDNNYVDAIEMEAGRSYALLVNNFSESGNGFNISFGGTGTFVGPQAAFTADDPDRTVCVGEAITFSDASSFAGTIEAWTWRFGNDASIDSLTGQGPHTINYNSAGLKSVVLEVLSEDNCLVTFVGTVLVECCDDHFELDGLVNDLSCPRDSNGAIDLQVTNAYGPYSFDWNTGAANEDLANLGPGSYSVRIADAANCDTLISFDVESPDTFAVDTFVQMPTCNGGTDGAVRLAIEGGTMPYQFNWQNGGFGNADSLTNLSVSDVDVVVRDANGCTIDLVIPVRELELQLDLDRTEVLPPRCNGLADGSLSLFIGNGLPPYQFNFNDGNGFQPSNSLTNLPAGIYPVAAIDDNLCRGNFNVEIVDHPPVAINIDGLNISCNGEADGSITALPDGGIGNYSYSWSTGAQTATLDNLPVGTYTITVADGNNCQRDTTITLTQPPPLGIENIVVEDVLCFGDPTGVIDVIGQGGSPPYLYSVDGINFQENNRLAGNPAGSYRVVVQDLNGCIFEEEVAIDQPPQLLVDAGPDRVIDLGDTVRLRAQSTDNQVRVQWSPVMTLRCNEQLGSGICLGPTAQPLATQEYTVVVTDSSGCTAEDKVLVTVRNNRPIYAPNAFSPNKDFDNEFFTLYGGPGARQIMRLRVFSRWGELLFEDENLALGGEGENQGWDGTFRGDPAPAGVYVYYAEVEFIDGQVLQYQGEFTLIR